MKGGEEHVVYLPKRAVSLLKDIAAMKLSETMVFPSLLKEAKPLSSVAMLALLTRMGYRDSTTVHGVCRSTFSTWANETAAARPDVVEAALAHNEADKVRAAYNRAKFSEERRALLVLWSDYLDAPAAPVVAHIGKAA
jgi:integrase